MSAEQYPIHVSAKGLERVAALRLSGLPLATFLALLARLDSAGRAEITQPELGKLLSTGPGKVWQSLPGTGGRRRHRATGPAERYGATDAVSDRSHYGRRPKRAAPAAWVAS
jgi:hypothetical protein